MITLSNDNELVRIEAYEELLARPRFSPTLDPATAKLEKLLGYYVFSPRVACGLSNCRKEHFTGFLAATTDGREVNIGNICGKREFGVDFVVAKRRLMADVRKARNREVVETFQSNLPTLLAQIAELKKAPNGVDWAYFHIKWLRPRFPRIVTKRLDDMVRDGNGTLWVEREATAQEQAAHEERTRKKLDRKLYVRVAAGRIDGYVAIAPANDLREMLTIRIERRLTEIADLNVDTARDYVVATAAAWISELPNKLQEVQYVLGEARRFLTKVNLHQFARLNLSQEELTKLNQEIEDLPATHRTTTHGSAAA